MTAPHSPTSVSSYGSLLQSALLRCGHTREAQQLGEREGCLPEAVTPNLSRGRPAWALLGGDGSHDGGRTPLRIERRHRALDGEIEERRDLRASEVGWSP